MMQTPPDYPVTDTDTKLTNDTVSDAQITYRTLREKVLANEPVTDDMIKTALLKLECAYGDDKNTTSAESILPALTLSALKKRLRIGGKTNTG